MRRQCMTFQSTRPRGARRPCSLRCSRVIEFQSTRPRGARRCNSAANAVSYTFQSTRPRGARRRRSIAAQRARRSFQSTRPRGARRPQQSQSTMSQMRVSIHAPARGATWHELHQSTLIGSFNPRARAGRDDDALRPPICHDRFQSTRPRGARLADSAYARLPLPVSIHAPARGATWRHIRQRRRYRADRVSIHAPARGATARRLQSLARYFSVSIHAPARGATLSS